jgi:uncharacterized membrane protein YqjE
VRGVEPDSDNPDGSPGGPVRSLVRSIANLVATAVAIAHTRLELFSTELQQEVHRAAEILVWIGVALMAGGIGLFLLALAIVFVFWDTHRVIASIVVTSAFFLIALIAALVLRAKIRGKPRLLDATLTELAKDRANLAQRVKAVR